MSETVTGRLRAANPVPERPAPRPIAEVIPGWGADLWKEGPHSGEIEPPGRAHRRSSRWGSRALGAVAPLMAVLIAIVITVVALNAIHAGPQPGETSAPGAEDHFADAQGWSLNYPAGFSLTSRRDGGALTAGQVTLTSFPAPRSLTARPPNGTPLTLSDTPYALPLDAAGRFPSDGVALILEPSQAIFLGADSSFPISLHQFGPGHTEGFFSAANYRRFGIPPARHHMIVFYSQVITATALIGPKASPQLRGDLAAAVASLSIRRLSPGAHVGNAELLGRAGQYRVGSYTLVHPRFPSVSGPVYLVHAPGHLSYGQSCRANAPCAPAGTFYGIGGRYNTRREHAPTCQLRLDRRHQEFSCANLGVRWDRVGRVIRRPPSESYIGSIDGLNAKIAWDGQVMISPGFGPTLSRSAVHELWPGWRQPSEPLSK